MSALLAVEFTKILRRRLNQIALAVGCALLVLIYALLWLGTDVIVEVSPHGDTAERIRSGLFLEGTVPFAMVMLNVLGFVAGVVVFGAGVGAEYGWNTVRTMTAAEPRRWRVLLAKCVALWVAVVCGMAIGLAVALATSAAITLLAGEFSLSFVDLAYLRGSLESFARLLVATAPYFALAALLGVVGRSATAGIALALGVAFVEGIVGALLVLAGGWFAEVPRFMIDRNADALMVTEDGPFQDIVAAGQDASELFADVPAAPEATVVLLAWTACFLGAAFWTFARQDLRYEG